MLYFGSILDVHGREAVAFASSEIGRLAVQRHSLVGRDRLKSDVMHHIDLVTVVLVEEDVDSPIVILVAVIGDSEVKLCPGGGDFGAHGIGDLVSDGEVAVAVLVVLDNSDGTVVQLIVSVLYNVG